jgi:hypothetical protein
MEDFSEEKKNSQSERLKVFIRIRPLINNEKYINDISPIGVNTEENSIISKIIYYL